MDVYKEWLGIPDGPRPPDHYQLLRLKKFEDSVDKIRANYKKLNGHVRKYATGQFMDESQALLNELAKVMLCLTDLERKRDYDISLGREFDEEEIGPRKMDAILIEQKHITADQAQQAREYADKVGVEINDAFVQLKLVSPDVAAQALATELGLPYVDLSDTTPDDDVLDVVPKMTVKQHSILPLFADEGVVLVACVSHLSHELEDELRLRFNKPVRSVLASQQAIHQAIGKYYSADAQKERAAAREGGAAAAAAVAEQTGKKAAAATKAKKPEPAKKEPVKKRGPKTAEERKNDFLTGIVCINFSAVAAYLIDAFLLTPNVFFDKWTYLLFIAIPGITALIVSQTFWKK
ncbi:MAG: general secretion pathway protein GspE [Planctomycetes bacterium]|nr:general secretion pathway protein GspE [Planctomycetota bacterium]